MELTRLAHKSDPNPQDNSNEAETKTDTDVLVNPFTLHFTLRVYILLDNANAVCSEMQLYIGVVILNINNHYH